MAVKFIAMKCPSCGANLEIEEGRDRAFCTYCGTPIMINNENKHEYIYRTVDEGKIAEEQRKIKEAELRDKRLEREEKGERFSVIVGLSVIAILFLLLIFFL